MARTATARAWVLNLDAELELEAGEGYQPKASVVAAVQSHARPALTLLREGDVWLRDSEDVSGLSGWAFCMTPSARRRLEAAGARPMHAPSFEVLRAVNHRRFSFELGLDVDGACYVTNVGELERTVAVGEWLVKRPFAHAGRGRVRTNGGLDAHARRFAEATFQRGEGLLVEPFVDVLVDYSTHGWLERDGTLALGEPFVQETDARGAWRETRGPQGGELTEDERRTLEGAARKAGQALSAADYFGAFGVDGFRYRDGTGEIRLCALLEINGRFTMGWAKSGLLARLP